MITPVGATFGRDNSLVANSRPTIGRRPTTRKKFGVTTMPPSDSLPSFSTWKLNVQR